MNVEIRRFCTELVRSGIPVDKMAGLAAIVSPDVVGRGLRTMIEHNGGKTSGMIYGVAYMLKGIAKHYVRRHRPN